MISIYFYQNVLKFYFGKKTQGCFSYVEVTSQTLQQPGLGQAKAQSQELNLHLLHDWQESKCRSQHGLPSQEVHLPRRAARIPTQALRYGLLTFQLAFQPLCPTLIHHLVFHSISVRPFFEVPLYYKNALYVHYKNCSYT